MEIGMCLPYAEPGLDRTALLSWSRSIDMGPFDAISCGERITGPGVDMRGALAAAAAVTERVRIEPSLYILPMHDAVLAAKEIATLDVISGGRVNVTVGVGGREFDYRAVGASFARRHARMDDQVALMRKVWHGELPPVPAYTVGPAPVQPGGPPIHAGVLGPKAMARAAHWADGVYVWSGNGERAEIEALLRMADEAWEAAGRVDPPRRIAGFWFSLAPVDAAAKLRGYVTDYLAFLGPELAGAIAGASSRHDPAAVAAAIDDMEDLGCDRVHLVPATAELAEVDRAAEVVARR